MRHVHVVVILLLSLCMGESYAGWKRINPKPTNVQLNGICFVDSLNVWAVGSSGTLIHSTDGGESWSEQVVTPKGELQKVAFTDALHGVIVGGDISAQNGALFVTTDGGVTWADKHPNPMYRYAYFDVQFVSPLRGWIAGFEGIFRTTDGGQSWLRSTSSGLGWNTSTFFLDSLNGWCTNPTGKIMKSTDGGTTWLPQASLGMRWFERIRFATSQTGWAVGGGLYETKGVIARTTDGGTTWVIQDSVEGLRYHDIYVVDSLRAWVVGDHGIVRYTTDAGSLWFTAPTNNTDTYLDVTFQGNQCWIVGGSYFYPVILTAQNGGNPRVTKSSYFTLANLTAMQFTSDTTGWLAADDGTLFKSTNGGVDWKPYNLFAVPWRSMSAPDRNSLFVGGDGGAFLRTMDGGQTWVLSTISGIYRISHVQFVNTQVGWLLSDEYYGGLFKTTNGGTSWVSLKVVGSKFKFLDEQNGWLIAPIGIVTSNDMQQQTRLLHTTDGGNTWFTQSFDTPIHDITFISSEKGWLSSGYDSLYVTTDGGNTWSPLSRIDDIPYELSFVTEKEGWVRGSQSIFHTTDGGSTFTKEYGAMTQLPQGMCFPSGKLGFVFGHNGGLVRYSNVTTDVDEPPINRTLPDGFVLLQNYPNPFNPSTTIQYDLPKPAYVSIKVYDVLGRVVVTLVDGMEEAGHRSVVFDATGVSSGVYFSRLQAGEYVKTRKMLLLK